MTIKKNMKQTKINFSAKSGICANLDTKIHEGINM